MPLPPSGRVTPGPPLAHYAGVAHVARVYEHLLGGKDNFAADREAAEQAMQIHPDVVPAARANRAFLARTTRYLTGEAGLWGSVVVKPLHLARPGARARRRPPGPGCGRTGRVHPAAAPR